MRNKNLLGGAAALLGASLLFAGCGTRTEPGTGSTAGETKVAKIGVIAPLSGSLSALGLGIRNSVDLAIRQANESNAIPGWKLELAAEDDEAKPDVGKNAATKLAGDAQVVGVVGTLNSSVALSVVPVLSAANILDVSPANTTPSLTKGEDFANNPKRVYANYFRTATTDAVQGKALAEFLFKEKGYKKVATINDKKVYGLGLVKAFSKEYTDLGGTIVAEATINPDEGNYATVVTSVKAKNPEAVLYGGEYPQAGPLTKQMKTGGLRVPLIGGDGIKDPNFMELGDKYSEGDFASSVGDPSEVVPEAKAMLDAYEKAGFKEPMGAYGAHSYDAAQAIITALKTSLPSAADAKSAREATIKAAGSASFAGASGKVSFDEYGDTTTRVITVYEAKGSDWVAQKTYNFS